jgi:hypothetical protein
VTNVQKRRFRRNIFLKVRFYLRNSSSSDDKLEMYEVDIDHKIADCPALGKRSRSILDKEQVVEIFEFKVRNSSQSDMKKRISATSVAERYGVSEKTIRDIWRARTWHQATWHLDMARPLLQSKLGRPKGSKDSRPRMYKVANSRVQGDGSSENRQWGASAFSLATSDTASEESVKSGSMKNAIFPESWATDEVSGISCSKFEVVSKPEPTESCRTSCVDTLLADWSLFHASFRIPAQRDPFRKDWSFWSDGARAGI